MLARGGVDDLYRLSDFSGHVKEAVGAQPDAVRPRGTAEVDGIHELLRGSVQNFDGASVGPRLAHAGITVDRDVREASIFGDDCLVTSNVFRFDCCGYFAGIHIDELHGVKFLIDNQ